jgi:hypothetical protein
VVEHLPHHPKVEGQSPATAVCTGREKTARNSNFVLTVRRRRKLKTVFYKIDVSARSWMFDVINKYFDVIEEDEAEDDGDENDVDEDVDDEDDEEVEEHEPVFATQVSRECSEHLKPEILNNLMFHKVF